MKRILKAVPFILVLIILGSGLQPVFGQLAYGSSNSGGLQGKLQSMLEENATGYISPFVTGFGEALNSGWFHSAKPHKLLGFDLGVKMMAVAIADENTVFDFVVPDFSQSITIDQNSYTVTLVGNELYPDREVPSIFGEKKTGIIQPAAEADIVTMFEQQLLSQGVSQTVLNQSNVQSQLQTLAAAIPTLASPPGLGFKYMPMMVPQAAVGLSIPMTPIHAEIAARYLPEYEISKDIGKISFLGFGGKLALDPFIPIPLFPIDISIGAYMQKLELGNLLESTSMLYNVQVGKDLNLLVLKVGVFGAVGLEKTNMKFSYVYAPDNQNDPLYGTEVNFDLDGENSFRYTLGARVQLAVVNVSAAYTHSADDIFTLGAGISIR